VVRTGDHPWSVPTSDTHWLDRIAGVRVWLRRIDRHSKGVSNVDMKLEVVLLPVSDVARPGALSQSWTEDRG